MFIVAVFIKNLGNWLYIINLFCIFAPIGIMNLERNA